MDQSEARVGFNVGAQASGPWVVPSGSGDDVGLNGQGTVTGTQSPGGVTHSCVGWLSNGCRGIAGVDGAAELCALV